MKRCIWGDVQTEEKIAEGITAITTAGHGGFIVSPERYREMPEKYRKCSFTGDRHFEEDCSWCGVVLTWPQYFGENEIKSAQEIYENYYVVNER